jgi:Na+/H+ antiporter NhaD/arsenite permease-like protein
MKLLKFSLMGVFALFATAAFASGGEIVAGVPAVFGIRVEFILFALTLLGVALFHHHTLKVALTGLTAILAFKFMFDPGFHFVEHLIGEHPFFEQVLDKESREGEWSILLNLFGLLVGFAILAKYFEDSGVPDFLPKWLPDDWKGPFVLLAIVYILSTFLDNIAAAMIGGTIALVVFNRKVHIGYIAALVAASNAGGAGSVLGDTTTTMMWIDGVSAFDVTPAFVASAAAFFAFAFFASFQQDKYQRIIKDEIGQFHIDYMKLAIVGLILVATIITNVLFDFPAFGVWIAILFGSLLRKAPWHEAKDAIAGSIFLLSLVLAASLMPVSELPPASWMSALGLGFISSVFDNIPLTKLALDQGGYDWGVLAYAVGFGGSMVWFGSSAGVAISGRMPEARSVAKWIIGGWHVILAYVVGFFVMLWLVGWNPHPPHRAEHINQAIEAAATAPSADSLGVE